MVYVSIHLDWRWGLTHSQIEFLRGAAETRGVSEEEIISEEGLPLGDEDEPEDEPGDLIAREGFVPLSAWRRLEFGD